MIGDATRAHRRRRSFERVQKIVRLLERGDAQPRQRRIEIATELGEEPAIELGVAAGAADSVGDVQSRQERREAVLAGGRRRFFVRPARTASTELSGELSGTWVAAEDRGGGAVGTADCRESC